MIFIKKMTWHVFRYMPSVRFLLIDCTNRRDTMKKSLIALALSGLGIAPVFAEEAAATPEHSVTGNKGLS